MLSFARPSFFPTVPQTRRQVFIPKEGVPYVLQDDSHWFVKVLLPDVSENDFTARIDGDSLLLTWMDHKKISHRGRTYESRETFNKSLKIPEGISQEDLSVTWDGDIVIVSITKPVSKKEEPKEIESNNDIGDGTLLKIPVPSEGDHSINFNVKGNNVTITFESANKKEENGSYFTSKTRIQRTFPIPEGVNPSDIETNIEDGKLVVFVNKALPAPESDRIEEAPEEFVSNEEEEKKNEPIEEIEDSPAEKKEEPIESKM